MNKPFLQTALSFLLFIGSACQQASSTAQVAEESVATAPTTSQVINGKALFERYCTGCHGGDGKMAMNGAKDLSASILSKEEVAKIIAEGSENKAMMAYGNMLTANQISAVADYVLAFRK